MLLALGEIEIPWDYFLQFVGLQEQEQQPDPQTEGENDEYNPKGMVSPEPGSSSKASQQTTNKKKAYKTKGTPSRTNKSVTPMKEETPQMQLRYSLQNKEKMKVARFLARKNMHKIPHRAHCHLTIQKMNM